MPEQPGGDTRRRRPTIRDVAARAGVSKSLVSLVLSDSPRVSDTSRAAVLEAIRELGYRPSAMARGLVSGHSGLLGMITSNASDFFFFEVIEGVSARLAETSSGLVPLVLHGTREQATELRAAEQFLGLGVEGLMLMGSALSDVEIERLSDEVPLLVVGRRVDSSTVDSVTGDDEGGGALAARHLLDLGHRRIAHITGGAGNGSAERERGFRHAVEEGGGEAAVVEGGYTLEGGQEGARLLLESPGPSVTAIFAANDLCAIGAMRELQAAGLRVPEDVSMIGYDDVILASLPQIELTTISQSAKEIGRTAANLLIRRAETGRREAQQALIEPALVIRSTTRPV